MPDETITLPVVNFRWRRLGVSGAFLLVGVGGRLEVGDGGRPLDAAELRREDEVDMIMAAQRLGISFGGEVLCRKNLFHSKRRMCEARCRLDAATRIAATHSNS